MKNEEPIVKEEPSVKYEEQIPRKSEYAETGAPSEENSIPSLVTLTSVSTSLFDSVVLDIAAKLEDIYDEEAAKLDAGTQCFIELEARLGIINDERSTDGERLALPVRGEALMVDSTLFPYSFVAGVNESDFAFIQRDLHSVLSQASNNSSEPVTFSTRDEIYSISEADLLAEKVSRFALDAKRKNNNVYDIRASYVNDYKSDLLEIVFKSRHCVFDIHTGDWKLDIFNEPEGQPCDIRIAVNLEHKLRNPPLNRNNSKFQRLRTRTSFPIDGRYRIDTTKVETNYMSRSETYEVEVECNPVLLVEQLKLKKRGKPHLLYHIIHEFLNVIRGMIKILQERSKTGTKKTRTSMCAISGGAERKKTRLSTTTLQLGGACPSEETINRYLNYVSPIVPLIGDYLYRAVAPSRELCNCPTLTQDEIADSSRIALNQQEINLLQMTME